MTVFAPSPAVPASPTLDTANIKQALATALPTGDEVVLTPGVYLVNETLVMGGTQAITSVSLRGGKRPVCKLTV